jgi:hypothetical protein
MPDSKPQSYLEQMVSVISPLSHIVEPILWTFFGGLIGGVADTLQASLAAGQFHFDLGHVASVGVTAGFISLAAYFRTPRKKSDGTQ